MKLKRLIPFLAVVISLILIFPNACSPISNSQESAPQPSQTKTLSIMQREGTLTATSKPDLNAEELTATPTPLLGEFTTNRTKQPTATMGPLTRAIEAYAFKRGASSTTFLGIRLVNWVNLLISALLVLIAYTIGTWLIKRALPSLVKRTAHEFDDEIIKRVGPEIRWLVTVMILRYAVIERLTFLGENLLQTLSDIFYVLIASLVVWILWGVVNLSANWYAGELTRTGRENIKPVIQMVSKTIQILIGFIGVTILLSHFGVNVTTLTAALGIGGLAISLAAQNTVADAISGFIILVDQPFRVGDRIEIRGMDTWGDVTEIGLRTTRIRTRDNRMVIVPNSILSNNQVINYSYPDSRYRIQTHIYVPYNENVEKVRQLLIRAIKNVEGVLAEKPVDVLFVDMTENHVKFRLRWWIDSYEDTRIMFDRVHTNVKIALDQAGIQSPNPIQDINLKIDPLSTDRFSRNFQAKSSEPGNQSESRIDSDGEQNSKFRSDE